MPLVLIHILCLVPLCRKPEPLIMDYQSQQMKLFPQIATAYAFILTGQQLGQLYISYVAQAQGGDFSALPEVCSWFKGTLYCIHI